MDKGLKAYLDKCEVADVPQEFLDDLAAEMAKAAEENGRAQRARQWYAWHWHACPLSAWFDMP